VALHSANPLALPLKGDEKMRSYPARNVGDRVGLVCFFIASVIALSAGGPAFAATDMFLSIPGIPGESVDVKFPQQIVVLSYAHNITLPVVSGGSCASRSVHQPFRVVKYVDRASPELSQSVCSGVHYTSVTLTVVRVSGARNKLIEYQLGDVFVTSVTPNGSTTSSLPTEEIAFSYVTIRWTYYYEGANGVIQNTYVGGWNTATNTALQGLAKASDQLLGME
jgi:type VI secretion system secreted protein Hcp